MRVLVLAGLLAASLHAEECPALPPLPDKEGFAGAFAGVSGGALLVAGGANFPNKKPWEGGEKIWYDTVFVLEKPEGTWTVAGKLPRALGYGVCVTYGEQVICVGGSDAKRHFADAFQLEWRGGKLRTTQIPPLPKALANMSGALVGDTLYISGGIESPGSIAASRSTFRMDLKASELRWDAIEPCPGPARMLAVAAGYDGAFWIAGGAELVVGSDGKVERKYLKDAYRYTPGKGWKRIADLPAAVVAAPSPAPADASGFFILGGDDGSQVGTAPERHRGFSEQILRYDPKTDRWMKHGTLSAPRVTVPCVRWRGRWVIPSGEIRPGVRSPDVTVFLPTNKE